MTENNQSDFSFSGNQVSENEPTSCYSNQQQAFLFNKSDGSGMAYYPSGRVAVVVARVPTPQGVKFQRYFYDDTYKSPLICSFDEHVVGFAQATTKEEDGKKLVSTRKGCIISNNKGEITSEWKWDRNAQGAGELPKEEVLIYLNEYLTFRFASRKNVTVSFSCEGISKDFDCSEQLRRENSYLDNCKIIREGIHRGKIMPDIPFKTLVDRQHELEQQMAFRRNLNRPCSKNIKYNNNVKDMMKQLEAHFAPYEDKIAQSNFGNTFMDEGWKTEAYEKTMKEVPRILSTGQETGENPVLSSLGGIKDLQEIKDSDMRLGVHLPKVWPTELEVRKKLSKENPNIGRSYVLRNASGRYSRSSPVKVPLEPTRPVDLITTNNFDQIINDNANKLVVIVCLREDDLLCVATRQIFEKVNAMIHEAEYEEPRHEDTLNSKQAKPLPPTCIYRFAMSESRFLNEKYGVFTLPAYLAFYNGQLVRADVLGARPVKIIKSKYLPRLLLFEKDFRSQIQIEKLLKKMKYQSELAISSSDAVNHINFRARITTANAITYYGIVLIDSSVSATQARAVVQACKRASSADTHGVCLVVSMLSMNEAKLCKNLKSGIVPNPTPEQLLDNTCHVAITRPLKSSTMEILTDKWRKLQQSVHGNVAAEPMENKTHFGEKKEDIIRYLHAAMSDVRNNNFLPKDYKIGMKLSANKTTSNLHRNLQGLR